MFLAEFNMVDHMNDHPWPGFQIEVGGVTVTLMSSAIASMVLVAIAMLAIIIPLARRRTDKPTGGRNVVEVLVLFVRDSIARPVLHEHTYRLLPFLVTLFVYLLGLNLIGLSPLEAISGSLMINGNSYPVGYTATSVLSVTGAHAAIVLVVIVYHSVRRQRKLFMERHRVPMIVGGLLSPFLWIKSMVPAVPGAIGVVLFVPLLMLEIASLAVRCFALMIRLFANMLAGHAMLAVFMMFILSAAKAGLAATAGVGLVCVLASVAVMILELLVAGLQAYIFTFLSAVFLGLYMDPSH